ncbi:P-loop containing nucleoside triphosphate hydrolase [Trinorchestia longiramus]|nr:P-loop containing nucleoside triphosphate hydrolase [Trinorchestia longiramus]
MWGGDSEGGLSVLARAAARPTVAPLHPALLPGLKPGDAVQVSGDAGNGCSMLLYDLVARALLPSSWKGVDLGGCGAQVLFLDTDLHFCVLQLSVVAEGCVRKAVRAARRKMKAAAEGGSSCAASTTSATGMTAVAETSVHLAGKCKNDHKNINYAEVKENNVDIDRINCKKSYSLENVTCGLDNLEPVFKKKKSINHKVCDKVSDGLDAVVVSEIPEKQTPAVCSSRATGLHSSSTSLSTDLSSLQWLRKTPLVKLKRLIKELVASCLENLQYLRCSYSTQFMTTLLCLDALLTAFPRVSLICVDSLSNFYWHDRAFGYETWKNTEQYYNKIIKSALDCVSKNKVTFVGVQQPLFAKQKFPDQNSDSSQRRVYEHYNFLGRSWACEVRYKIQIKRTRKNGLYEFVVSERDRDVRTISAVYRPEGITWVKNE